MGHTPQSKPLASWQAPDRPVPAWLEAYKARLKPDMETVVSELTAQGLQPCPEARAGVGFWESATHYAIVSRNRSGFHISIFPKIPELGVAAPVKSAETEAVPVPDKQGQYSLI